MIEVLIKSVSPFAEYEGLVYSYKVICILNSGREISFVDERPFDLTEMIDKKAKIELASYSVSKSKDCIYLFEGVIEYSKLSGEYHFVGDEINIFLSREFIDFSNFKINEKRDYCFEEFILKTTITET